MKEVITISRLTEGAEGTTTKWAQFVKSFLNTEEGKVSLANPINMGWHAVPPNSEVGGVLAEGEECAAFTREMVILKDEDGNPIYSENPRKVNGVPVPNYTYRLRGINDTSQAGQSDIKALRMIGQVSDDNDDAAVKKTVEANLGNAKAVEN